MSRSPLQFHLRGPSSRARSLPVLGSIAQAIHAFGTEATDPFADGLRGRIELARSRGFGHAAIHNSTNHFLSTFGGQASILRTYPPAATCSAAPANSTVLRSAKRYIVRPTSCRPIWTRGSRITMTRDHIRDVGASVLRCRPSYM